jgi:hypothetical protein
MFTVLLLLLLLRVSASLMDFTEVLIKTPAEGSSSYWKTLLPPTAIAHNSERERERLFLPLEMLMEKPVNRGKSIMSDSLPISLIPHSH